MKIPWISRAEAAKLRAEVEQAKASAAQARVAEQAALEEAGALRALVMQLRVMQTQERGRTGFAVTAFIPEEVVQRIRNDGEKQRNFIHKVARHLVRRAVLGLVHVSQPGNRPIMLTFEPLVSKEGRLVDIVVGAWKEHQKRPIILGGPSTTTKQLPQ